MCNEKPTMISVIDDLPSDLCLPAADSSLINGGRGFPVQKYKDDRWGLIATYWGIGLQIGRALITQNDYNKDKGVIEGSILNHVSNYHAPAAAEGAGQELMRVS